MALELETERKLGGDKWGTLREQVAKARRSRPEEGVAVNVDELDELLMAAEGGGRMTKALELLREYPDHAVRNVAMAALKKPQH